MKLYKFAAVIKPTNGVPALPEIVTSGDSVEEAVFMAQDAIELVVLSKLEEGEFIPADKKPKRAAPKDKDIRRGTLKSIIKQSGLSEDSFRK